MGTGNRRKISQETMTSYEQQRKGNDLARNKILGIQIINRLIQTFRLQTNESKLKRNNQNITIL